MWITNFMYAPSIDCHLLWYISYWVNVSSLDREVNFTWNWCLCGENFYSLELIRTRLRFRQLLVMFKSNIYHLTTVKVLLKMALLQKHTTQVQVGISLETFCPWLYIGVYTVLVPSIDLWFVVTYHNWDFSNITSTVVSDIFRKHRGIWWFSFDSFEKYS